MATDRIVAWVRLRDVGRFVRDAEATARSIKRIANAAKDGEGPFGGLGTALGNFADVLPKARTETGILGLTLGSLITVIIAGTPIIVGLGGAVVALAGSFTQATIGAGALGVALAGAAIPLGAFGLVAMQAFKGFTKVNTAFQQWQVQVGQYGRNSTQAETALGRLNSIAKQFGGDTMISLVQQWSRFQKLFAKANAPALQDLIKMFSLFLSTAEKLLPVFSALAKVASSQLLDAFRLFASVLTGPEVMGILKSMGDTFSYIAGPIAQSLINFFVGFLTIAQRLAPALDWLVNGVLGLSEGFLNWARTGSLSILVDQFKSWIGLIGATARLLMTLLNGGASEGKSLVDTLTHILNRWNEWLQTVEGQKSLHDFFRDAGNMTKGFVKIIAGIIAFFFKFGRAALPLYTKVFAAIVSGVHEFMEALKPFKPFWDNVLGPLLKGFAEGVIGGVVGSFKFLIAIMKIVGPILGGISKHLGFLKGTFETVGKVIGFLFGGWILKVLGSLGKLTVLLKPLAAIFRILELPIRMAGGVVGFLFKQFERLSGLFYRIASGSIPVISAAFRGILNFITGWGAKFFDAGAMLWKKFRNGIMKAIGSGLGFAADIGKAVYNFVAGLINKGIPNSLGPINIPNNPIPMLAAGGIVSGSGSWITGEAGPEINTLRNGKVTVVPLSPAVSAQGTSATLAPSEKKVIVTKVYLRGKQIAEAVADEAEDEAARK